MLERLNKLLNWEVGTQILWSNLKAHRNYSTRHLMIFFFFSVSIIPWGLSKDSSSSKSTYKPIHWLFSKIFAAMSLTKIFSNSHPAHFIKIFKLLSRKVFSLCESNFDPFFFLHQSPACVTYSQLLLNIYIPFFSEAHGYITADDILSAPFLASW